MRFWLKKVKPKSILKKLIKNGGESFKGTKKPLKVLKLNFKKS